MMSHLNLLLLDVPDPVRAGGPIGLMLLAFVVLIITVVLVVGFVFLLKRRKLAGSNSTSGGRLVSSGASEQPHPSKPNQP
jgi:hypothetical protein